MGMMAGMSLVFDATSNIPQVMAESNAAIERTIAQYQRMKAVMSQGLQGTPADPPKIDEQRQRAISNVTARYIAHSEAIMAADKSSSIFSRGAGQLVNDLRGLARDVSAGSKQIDMLAERLDAASMFMWRFIVADIPLRQISNTFMMIGAAAAGALTGIARTYSQYQELEIMLRGTTKSAQESADAIARSYAFAARTPFDVQQVATEYMVLRRLGKDVADSMLEPVANLAAAMRERGHDPARAAEAMVDAVYGDFRRLRETYHLTRNEIKALAPEAFDSAGKVVDANAFMLAATQAIYARYGNVLDDFVTTLTGRWSNISDSFKLTLVNLGKSTSIFDMFMTKAESLTAQLNVLSETNLAGISVGVMGFVTALSLIGIAVVNVTRATLSITALYGAVRRFFSADLRGIAQTIANAMGVVRHEAMLTSRTLSMELATLQGANVLGGTPGASAVADARLNEVLSKRLGTKAATNELLAQESVQIAKNLAMEQMRDKVYKDINDTIEMGIRQKLPASALVASVSGMTGRFLQESARLSAAFDEELKPIALQALAQAGIGGEGRLGALSRRGGNIKDMLVGDPNIGEAQRALDIYSRKATSDVARLKDGLDKLYRLRSLTGAHLGGVVRSIKLQADRDRASKTFAGLTDEHFEQFVLQPRLAAGTQPYRDVLAKINETINAQSRAMMKSATAGRLRVLQLSRYIDQNMPSSAEDIASGKFGIYNLRELQRRSAIGDISQQAYRQYARAIIGAMRGGTGIFEGMSREDLAEARRLILGPEEGFARFILEKQKPPPGLTLGQRFWGYKDPSTGERVPGGLQRVGQYTPMGFITAQAVIQAAEYFTEQSSGASKAQKEVEKLSQSYKDMVGEIDSMKNASAEAFRVSQTGLISQKKHLDEAIASWKASAAEQKATLSVISGTLGMVGMGLAMIPNPIATAAAIAAMLASVGLSITAAMRTGDKDIKLSALNLMEVYQRNAERLGKFAEENRQLFKDAEVSANRIAETDARLAELEKERSNISREAEKHHVPVYQKRAEQIGEEYQLLLSKKTELQNQYNIANQLAEKARAQMVPEEQLAKNRVIRDQSLLKQESLNKEKEIALRYEQRRIEAAAEYDRKIEEVVRYDPDRATQLLGEKHKYLSALKTQQKEELAQQGIDPKIRSLETIDTLLKNEQSKVQALVLENEALTKQVEEQRKAAEEAAKAYHDIDQTMQDLIRGAQAVAMEMEDLGAKLQGELNPSQGLGKSYDEYMLLLAKINRDAPRIRGQSFTPMLIDDPDNKGKKKWAHVFSDLVPAQYKDIYATYMQYGNISLEQGARLEYAVKNGEGWAKQLKGHMTDIASLPEKYRNTLAGTGEVYKGLYDSSLKFGGTEQMRTFYAQQYEQSLLDQAAALYRVRDIAGGNAKIAEAWSNYIARMNRPLDEGLAISEGWEDFYRNTLGDEAAAQAQHMRTIELLKAKYNLAVQTNDKHAAELAYLELIKAQYEGIEKPQQSILAGASDISGFLGTWWRDNPRILNAYKDIRYSRVNDSHHTIEIQVSGNDEAVGVVNAALGAIIGGLRQKGGN